MRITAPHKLLFVGIFFPCMVFTVQRYIPSTECWSWWRSFQTKVKLHNTTYRVALKIASITLFSIRKCCLCSCSTIRSRRYTFMYCYGFCEAFMMFDKSQKHARTPCTDTLGSTLQQCQVSLTKVCFATACSNPWVPTISKIFDLDKFCHFRSRSPSVGQTAELRINTSISKVIHCGMSTRCS